MSDVLRDFQVDTSLADVLGFNPFYNRVDRGLSKRFSVNGRPMIDLASNNYLGLADDRRVKKSLLKGAKKYGASLCGTPIATGYADVLDRVQTRLSLFAGVEKGLVFPSCYQANGGIFTILVNKGDVVYFDHYAHASLIEGIRQSQGKLKPFLHNNMDHLEKQLKSDEGRKFIVTESVFSTEGSIAPLDKIIALCEKYGATPVVDDSHGIGVLGKGGAGVLSHFGITDYRGVYTASLGKALAVQGGFVGGPAPFIEYMKYYCGAYIYSTAISPPLVSAIEAVLDTIERDFDRISSVLWGNQRIISELLDDLGIDHHKTEAPIISLKTGSVENTVRTAQFLYDQGLFTTPFIPPSVPQKRGVVRVIAGADLSKKQLKRVCAVLTQLKGAL